jgi:FAD/FMN-containing dehydrogenase
VDRALLLAIASLTTACDTGSPPLRVGEARAPWRWIIAAANGAGSNEVPGHHRDVSEGAEEKAHVTAAMDLIRAATPDSGSYVNETDYFERDWQRSVWGTNYPRLLEIKRRYDPNGLFRCHHCVGSEDFAH